jgi:hypothetical protein
MKKQYIKSHAVDMSYVIDRYIRMNSFYIRDIARADRIESELLTLSDDAVSAARDFTGINPRSLIIELRDSKYVDDALVDIARVWRHTSITKDQRALLGKDAMKKINSIYKTL